MSLPKKFSEFAAEYNSWRGMRERCNKPHHISYRWYGAVGVKVCSEWDCAEGFELFLAHIGRRPDGTVLDRIDTARGYEPGNVRWVSALESTRNRRRPQMPQMIITIDGISRTVSEWAAAAGTTSRVVRKKLQRGESPRMAVLGESDGDPGTFVHPMDMAERRQPYPRKSRAMRVKQRSSASPRSRPRSSAGS